MLLRSGLNATGHLRADYKVPDSTFGHLDFTYAKDADVLVYNEVLHQLALKDQLS